MKEVSKTNKLSIHSNLSAESLTLIFQGVIDEDFNISEIQFESHKTVFVDFDKLSQINSCGIRQFISFMTKYLANASVLYVNCPSYLVYQMSLVAGFIGENRKIKSFYVPYFSETKDSDLMMKFDLGSFESDLSQVPSKLSTYTDEEGNLYEFDGFQDKFFQFLKLQ